MRTIFACLFAMLLFSTSHAESADDEVARLKAEVGGLKELQQTLLERLETLLAAQSDNVAEIQALKAQVAADLQANKPVFTTQLWRGRNAPRQCPDGMAPVFAVCAEDQGAAITVANGEVFECSRDRSKPLRVYCVPFAALDAQ